MSIDRLEELIRELLVELGEDPTREGLLRTPERMAQSLRFLTGGYDSVIAADHPDVHFRNRPAWGGTKRLEFTLVRVDLADFAGRTVSFRWRIRCDAAVNLGGWWVDDVRLFFGTDCSAVFADGFESGDAAAWAD